MMLISKYGNGSEEIVNEFESKHCIDLDEGYRRFLVKYNGGDTPKTTIRVKGISSDIRYFFGINVSNNIDDYLQQLVWENKRCLPIGEDSFGNCYVIGIADDNKGYIYFSNHEKGFQLTQIADSFGKFLSLCKSEKINPRSQRSPEEREAELVAKGKANNITDGLREMWKQEYEKYKDMILEEVILG